MIACLLLCGGCYSGVDGTRDSAPGDSAEGGSEADGSGGESGSGGEDEFDPLCKEDSSVSPLRRLSAAQYRNTLRDLFAPVGVDVEAEIPTDLERIPEDNAALTFGLQDTSLSEQHARAYYRIADGLSYAVTGSDDLLGAVAGDCAVAGNVDAACIDGFVDDFGVRVYRRPLVGEERARLHAVAAGADNSIEAWRAIIFSVLLAPQFLYHVEVEGEGGDDDFAIGPYELASRLSYHFWGSMPDEPLFAAADDGSILTASGYEAQLDRIFADERTQQTVDRFYDEWLNLGWFSAFPDTAAIGTLAEGTTIGDEDADHLSAAQAEIHALTRHYTWATDGTLKDILLSDRSFTASPHLAALYGVEAWDGTGEPPRMPDGERAGLVTRVAFLLTGDHETHPVHRGAAVKRRIMCEELPSPDPTSLPDGALDPPPVNGEQTTRERYEDKTADAACVSCHAQINPTGFVLERYDALGRFRAEELVIDEQTGEVLTSLPIDSRASVRIGEEAREISTGLELSEELAASGKVEACFATQYFRATFGREDTVEDECEIEHVTQTLVDGGTMREALRAVAETAAFRSRRVQ